TWAFFALMGGLVELGPPRRLLFLFRGRWPRKISRVDLGRVAVAVVLIVCLPTLVIYNSWDARVLYQTDISPGPAGPVLGQSIYPYVAGYYNSTQYRICCLEVGVSFAQADLRLLSPDNFLMAGMGVQSPNCCVDGWDLGWRADVFLMPDGSLIVSGSTWGTCDGNANCGGYFWQQLRYHAQATLNTQNVSTLVHLRMMWEPVTVNGQTVYEANWYYNTTTTSWTRFGSFLPDFREGHYFDIGLVGGITTDLPQGFAYFSQFGVASKYPVSGWKVLVFYPSFQYQGAWRMMERANIVQGDHSYWKVMYRWGGEPYRGVTVEASSTNSSLAPGIAEFVYNGTTAKEFAPLW
ncbi:MAG TPA: hypothetical protein VFJ63_00505, partial [Candidatus Bathyarchaeia archaeon]|nr:hypothetical protein [Candidatus Bathyarchaeia archaeon]